MSDIISKVHIPCQPRTGVVEEREYFAKLQEEERAMRKQARRARLLGRFGWRTTPTRATPRR